MSVVALRIAVLSLVAGCTNEVEVVARLSAPRDGEPHDASASVETDAAPDSPARDEQGCAEEARALFLIDDNSGFSRLWLESAATEKLPQPSCLDDVVTATVDQTGAVWAATSQRVLFRVSPDLASCTQIATNLAISSMTFVYEPAARRELLYAATDGSLLELDPQTHVRRTVGALQAGLLIGNNQGQLRVLRDEAGAGLVLTDLNRVDASPTLRSTSMRLDESRLLSASSWAADVALLLASGLYRLRTTTNQLELVASFPAEPQVVALAASVCAASAR